MAYRVTKAFAFSASHALPGYDGPCAEMHEHDWKVAVTVRAGQLNSSAFVIDFFKLEELWKRIKARFDGGVINEVEPFNAEWPTSENLARWMFEEFERGMPLATVLERVEVWEDETSGASYSAT